MHIVLDARFCFSQAPWLTWGDLKYGLEHGFLNPEGVVAYAMESLSADSPPESYELAGLAGSDADYIVKCLENLEKNDFLENGESKSVWIFLVFLWVFINKNSFRDPLILVEELYSDFDYPEIISPMVRYMPVEDRSLEGEDQLYKNWENMLETSRSELQARRARRSIHLNSSPKNV